MEKKKTPRTRPLFFQEFGQEARDLLRKGYLRQNRKLIKVSTCSTDGLTIESSLFENRSGSASAIRAVYDEKDKSIAAQFRSTRLKDVDPMFDDSEISVRVAKARESPPPSARPEISFYYPEYQDSGTFVTNLKLWCLPHRNAAVTFFADMPKICRKYSMSASIGTPSIAFGMQGMLGLPSISGGHFTVWDAGIQVTKSACDASITLRLCCTKKGQIGYHKGHWLEASYVHYLGEAKKISAGVKMTLNLRTGRGRSTIGGSWGGEDDRTAVKARFDNRGILKALLRHDIHDNARLSISSEYDVGEASGPRFGLALVLKPKN